MPAIPLSKNKVRDIHRADRLFQGALAIIAGSVIALLFGLALLLLIRSWPAIQQFGFAFVHTSVWDPVREIYGAGPLIYGTLVSSLLALLIATPVSLGIALYLNEIAPRRLSVLVGFLVEMLAAIPSVVYGLWGIFVLVPWLKDSVEPFVGSWADAISAFFGVRNIVFGGPHFGYGMLASGLILAIMVTPTISSICREVFRAVPRSQREAALALGATRWEMMRLSVLKASRAGIFGAVILGLGRALGETMAVTMLIGNRAEITWNLFAGAQTMASAIANEYAEAVSDMHLAALTEVGLLLFAVTFVVNGLARLIIWRVTRLESKTR